MRSLLIESRLLFKTVTCAIDREIDMDRDCTARELGVLGSPAFVHLTVDLLCNNYLRWRWKRTEVENTNSLPVAFRVIPIPRLCCLCGSGKRCEDTEDNKNSQGKCFILQGQ